MEMSFHPSYRCRQDGLGLFKVFPGKGYYVEAYACEDEWGDYVAVFEGAIDSFEAVPWR